MVNRRSKLDKFQTSLFFIFPWIFGFLCFFLGPLLASLCLSFTNYDGLNIPGGNPSNLPLNSYKWALPVPQDEINANGAIQQNPGY